MTPEALEAEQKKIIRNALWASACCAFVLLTSYNVLPLFFSFPTELAERIAFALKTNLFVLLWVVIAVRMVSRVRFYSPQDNRGSAYTTPSEKIAVPLAFLQNTLEQSVIAAGIYLALATLITGPALALLPGAAFLFSIGRISFLRGYSMGAGGRAFGIVTTVLPTAAGYLWGIWLVLSST
jgi:hypothetical protein